MRGLVIFILALAVIALLGFLAAGIGFEKPIAGEKKDFKPLEFSTYTAAVCESKGDVVRCKDEVFVNCNGTISKAVDAAECNGIKVEAPKALGLATFGSEWKDPRQ